MILFVFKIGINAANAILFFVELMFAHFIYPRLIRHTDYLTTRYRIRRRNVSAGQCMWREICGGVDLRLPTIVITIFIATIGLALAYSLDHTTIPETIEVSGKLVELKSDLRRMSSSDVSCGALHCKQLLKNSTNVYRRFVALLRYPPRYENTEGDRRCGDIVVSCIGEGIGNTLPNKRDSRKEVFVNALCCEHCNDTNDTGTQWIHDERFPYYKKSINGIDHVRICSPDDTPLMKRAFEILRNNTDLESYPFITLHDRILPALIWDPSDGTEPRLYVQRRVDATVVRGFALVLLFLIAFVLIHYAIIFWRFQKGQSCVHHGTSDEDIRRLLQSMMQTAVDCNGSVESHDNLEKGIFYSDFKVVFDCQLYGLLECSVNMGNYRSGLTMKLASEEQVSERKLQKCPICYSI